MGLLRNVHRSHVHEEFVQSMIREAGDVPPPFGTIRELLCFAAVLAFQMGEFDKLDRSKGSEDIQINVFENNNSDDIIYTLAVAHSKNTDVLKSDSEVDMVDIFEGYANAGLKILKSWGTRYRSQNYIQAIIQGLYDNKFINDETATREEIIHAVSF